MALFTYGNEISLPVSMALFHIDAPFTNDILQHIINIDNVRNPIGGKCITTGQYQTDHGPTSYQRQKLFLAY